MFYGKGGERTAESMNKRSSTDRSRASRNKRRQKEEDEEEEQQGYRPMLVLSHVGKVLTGAVFGMALFSNAVLFPQFATVDDIPKEYFSNHKTIFGYVERVIDGDTIRIRHCRTRLSCPKPDPTIKRIYDSTLSIRLYGVDSPEIQKRKSDPTSQPYAEEAKQYASNLILNRKVRVKLLRKDRYGRALGKVETVPSMVSRLIPFVSGKKDLSVELIDRGFATLYTGGGAEYDGNRKLLEEKQKKAQRKQRGIWKHGSAIVTPSEYRRQQRQLAQHHAAATTATSK